MAVNDVTLFLRSTQLNLLFDKSESNPLVLELYFKEGNRRNLLKSCLLRRECKINNLRQNIIVSENPLKLRNKVYVKGLHLNFSQVYVLSSNLSDITLFQEIVQLAGYHQGLSTFHNGPGALCCLKIISIESNLANKVSYCVEEKLKTEI